MGDHTSVKFSSLGAIIQEFNVDGQNIVQGFTKKEYYEKYNFPWFGATIGRVANRIKDGIIQNLNGQQYELEKNNSPNALHGGSQGWGRLEFEGPTVVKRDGKDALLYTYLSPHNEAGYPGTVLLKVFYTVSEEVEEGLPRSILTMEYEAELVGDECEETVVNLTNHSYFNISGGESAAEGVIAKLATRDYLPLDTGIPVGPIEPHEIDTSKPFQFGPDVLFDDCFIVTRDVASLKIDTRSEPLKLLAEFHHPDTRMNLQVHSTDPAFQFYTGIGINVPECPGNPKRGQFSGFCIEPSRFVNAVNVPEWRQQVILKKGEKYGSKIMYKAWRGSQ